MTILVNRSLDVRFVIVINVYLQYHSLLVYLIHQQYLKIVMTTDFLEEKK